MNQYTISPDSKLSALSHEGLIATHCGGEDCKSKLQRYVRVNEEGKPCGGTTWVCPNPACHNHINMPSCWKAIADDWEPEEVKIKTVVNFKNTPGLIYGK